MSKTELLALLTNFQFDRIFEILIMVIGDKDDHLNGFINDFIKGQYDNVNLAMRVRLYINTKYKDPTEVEHDEDENEPDYYDALCKFDFKLQTSHFQQIYKQRKISAFLLHGECDEDGKDIRWLYNQILYLENLSKVKSIIIDFSSPVIGCYDRLLEELFITFGVNTKCRSRKEHLLELRAKLEEVLKTNHFICVIKHPECLLANEEELNRLYDELFSYLDSNLYPQKKSLLFLFLEHGKAEYCIKKNERFFLFKDEDTDYAFKAIDHAGMKIIDLAPIGKIIKPDIEHWTAWYLTEQPCLFTQLRALNEKAADILQDGDRPYQVIEQICTKLNIPIQYKWTE